LKHLRRKEIPRWHPDRLNLRTELKGTLNDGNGREPIVLVIRAAVAELKGMCEEILE